MPGKDLCPATAVPGRVRTLPGPPSDRDGGAKRNHYLRSPSETRGVPGAGLEPARPVGQRGLSSPCLHSTIRAWRAAPRRTRSLSGAHPSNSGTVARCCLILLTSEGSSGQVGAHLGSPARGCGRPGTPEGMTESHRPIPGCCGSAAGPSRALPALSRAFPAFRTPSPFLSSPSFPGLLPASRAAARPRASGTRRPGPPPESPGRIAGTKRRGSGAPRDCGIRGGVIPQEDGRPPRSDSRGPGERVRGGTCGAGRTRRMEWSPIDRPRQESPS